MKTIKETNIVRPWPPGRELGYEAVIESLYRPTDTRCIPGLGNAYRPPPVFRPGEWELVADMPKVGDDGQSVKVYECRMPARFFKIEAEAGKNSIDEPQPAYSVETGSGAHELAADIAKAIAEGMLSFSPKG